MGAAKVAASPDAHIWNSAGLPATGMVQHSNGAGVLQVGRRTGAAVEVIPEEPDGEMSIQGLEALIARGRRPALVAITHVPTNCGCAPHVCSTAVARLLPP